MPNNDPPAAGNNDAIAKLKKKRSLLKRKLTQLTTMLTSATADDYDDIQIRFNAAEPILHQFDDVHLEIQLIDDAAEHETYRDDFEKRYYEALSKARRYIRENRPVENVNDTTVVQSQSESSNVRMPKIDSPTFTGKYDEWRCFRDSYKSMIHDKPRIATIDKFYYLRSCLKEEAVTVLQSLETTEQNYNIAWELLVERYDNKRVIVHNHLKNLLELPPAAKESLAHLRQMLDGVNTHSRALKALGLNVDAWNAILIYCMTSKLGKITHQDWEKSIVGTDLPTLANFLDFLKTRCQILEATESQNSNTANTKDANKRNVMAIATRADYCHFCKGEHRLYTCERFNKLTQPERYQFVKEERLCFNCLRKNHMTEKCTCRPCKTCGSKHHTILHAERLTPPEASTESESTTSMQIRLPAQVLLATAKIHFLDRFNNKQTARVLLDSGAQAHFITERFANLLKLSRNRVNIPVSTLNHTQTSIAHSVKTKIFSRLGNYEKDISLLVVPHITSPLPSHSINVKELNIPQNLPLADPTFHQASEIDALIGAEVYFKIDCAGRVPIDKTDAVLSKTKFGWTVGGSINNVASQNHVTCNVSISAVSRDISRFWELDEGPAIKLLSREEAEVEQHFSKHFKRDASGRCVVKIPFNDKIKSLQNNYSVALKQFYSLERKLNKDSQLKKQYVEFMSEYENLGHMSR